MRMYPYAPGQQEGSILSDIKIGNYYVSVLDGSRMVLALGPFVNNHFQALEHVNAVNDYVSKHDPKGHFYAYGTVRMTTNRPGKLNSVIPH